jgi:hypothetical protein
VGVGTGIVAVVEAVGGPVVDTELQCTVSSNTSNAIPTAVAGAAQYTGQSKKFDSGAFSELKKAELWETARTPRVQQSQGLDEPSDWWFWFSVSNSKFGRSVIIVPGNRVNSLCPNARYVKVDAFRKAVGPPRLVKALKSRSSSSSMVRYISIWKGSVTR